MYVLLWAALDVVLLMFLLGRSRSGNQGSAGTWSSFLLSVNVIGALLVIETLYPYTRASDGGLWVVILSVCLGLWAIVVFLLTIAFFRIRQKAKELTVEPEVQTSE